MHLLVRTLGCWLGFGWAVLTLFLLLPDGPARHPAEWEPGYVLGAVGLSFIGVFFLAQAVSFTVRCVNVLRFTVDSQRIEGLATRMKSPSEWERRWAAQILADLFGEPFGPVSFGPISSFSTRAQCARMLALYRAWWSAQCDDHATAWHEALRAFQDNPVPPDLAPSGPHNPVLPDPVPSGRPPVPESERLRLDAAEVSPVSLPAGREGWGEKYSRFKAAEDGLPPPPKVIDRWVERFRRMEAGELPVPATNFPPEAPRQPDEGRGRPGAVRTRIEDVLGQMSDLIKDAILDWSLAVDSEPGEHPAPAPPIAPEDFARAVGGKIEDVLLHVAEAVNGGAGEQQIRDLMAELLWQALEYARQVRLQALTTSELPPE